MLIRSITVDNYKVFAGRNRIDLSEGRTVIYGRNETGKTILFNALRDYILGHQDTFAYASWSGSICTSILGGGPRDAQGTCGIEVELSDDEEGPPPELVFIGSDDLERIIMSRHERSPLEDDEDEEFDRRISDYLARLNPWYEHELSRTEVARSREILHRWVHRGGSSGYLASFAYILAMRDMRTTSAPLIIDDCFGRLAGVFREHVMVVLAGLEWQIILFTCAGDIAYHLGIDYVLDPTSHVGGIKVRTYSPEVVRRVDDYADRLAYHREHSPVSSGSP